MQIQNSVTILTMPRSLGTLTCAMLGQHPQMYGILETRLYEVESMEQWWDFEQEGGRTPGGLLRDLGEVLYGDQSENTMERVRRWLWKRRDWPTVDVMQVLASHVSPLRLVEKNPIPPANDESIAASLQRRLRCFPEARFLWLVRCPFCYGNSLLEMLANLESLKGRRRRKSRPGNHTGKTTAGSSARSASDPQTSWFRVNKHIQGFLRKLPEDRHRTIRGEELIAQPDNVLLDLVRWLGIRSDPRAIEEMKHPERSPFACMGPRNALGGGDGKFFRSPALRPPKPHAHRLQDPLPWGSDGEGLSGEVREFAAELGYT